MRTEIAISVADESGANYLGWSPVRSRIRLAEAGGATNPVNVRLKNQDTSRGGQVVFYETAPGNAQDELNLALPADGSAVEFFVGGKFNHPSGADRDAAIEVINEDDRNVLSVTPLMVRVRKNANLLTTGERDRFIEALARLNNRGMGRFSDFRNMHTNAADPEAHGRAGFLPWHRAYLLDLERELQNLDASVALPYWKFDEAAPNLFSRDFVGVPINATGTVQFSALNRLQFWTTDQTQGIVRLPRFDTAAQPAGNNLGPVLSEAATILLGGGGNIYAQFRRMEGQPHGRAHTSFAGYLSSIPTAAKDPLFFLLHANVDRLWAKWQWLRRRFDTADTAAYTFLGSAEDAGAERIGHNLNDTMWPWNQDTNPPRPANAPGGNFPDLHETPAPGRTPAVLHMIDYQGVLNPARRLGFDYDDVPFQF